MISANVEMLELAAAALADLPDEVAFVGGATVELWATDEAAPEFRPTEDVDVIVEIATRSAYYRFEDRLRETGFLNEEEDGVICRFRQRDSGLLLDAMPTEASILGFENRWQREAFPHAVAVVLPSGRSIRAIPPTYLLATKLEAFRARGKGDLYGSRDFEDVVALVDSREELVGEVAAAAAELRKFVSGQLGRLLHHEVFASAAEGALKGGSETRERFELVVRPRIEAIVAGRDS
ncbi:MAG TPA: nucleotidyl transferase AbiEii/AbiGii toxin family protein [Solirubrobacterales bacterium]|nr:nucleotidyl transferase AbiEii/AbiGii toxin family protein [Solirubrobacterales bacterium]